MGGTAGWIPEVSAAGVRVGAGVGDGRGVAVGPGVRVGRGVFVGPGVRVGPAVGVGRARVGVGECARVGEGVAKEEKGVAKEETIRDGDGVAGLRRAGAAVLVGAFVGPSSRKENDGKQPARRIRISVPHRPLRMDDPSGFRVGTLGGSALVVVPPGWMNYTMASPERSRALRKRTPQGGWPPAIVVRKEENGRR